MELAISIISIATAVISLITALASAKKANEAVTLHNQSTIKINELEQRIVILQNTRVSGIFGDNMVSSGNGGDGFHVGP
jgi:hypothetical protein